MTSPSLVHVGVKVTKKPSEEAHWSAPKLLEKKKGSGKNGTPKVATTSTLTGRIISSMCANTKLVRIQLGDSLRDCSTRSNQKTLRPQKINPLRIEYFYSNFIRSFWCRGKVLRKLLGRQSLAKSLHLFSPFSWKHNSRFPPSKSLWRQLRLLSWSAGLMIKDHRVSAHGFRIMSFTTLSSGCHFG
jgi:hypothetical protein